MNNILKELDNIPYILGLNMTTTNYVAAYYKVTPETIRNVLTNNKELKSNLVTCYDYNTIKKKILENGEIDTRLRAVPKVKTQTGEYIKISYSLTSLWTKESILEISKFLSTKKAKQVVKALNRIVNEINKDKLKTAFINNDIETFKSIATNIDELEDINYLKLKKSKVKIKELNSTIKNLNSQINTTIETDKYRQKIVSTLFNISSQVSPETSRIVQKTLFHELKILHKIDLVGRKYSLTDKYTIDEIKTIEEWQIAIDTLKRICKEMKIDKTLTHLLYID